MLGSPDFNCATKRIVKKMIGIDTKFDIRNLKRDDFGDVEEYSKFLELKHREQTVSFIKDNYQGHKNF